MGELPAERPLISVYCPCEREVGDPSCSTVTEFSVAFPIVRLMTRKSVGDIIILISNAMTLQFYQHLLKYITVQWSVVPFSRLRFRLQKF